MVSFCLTSARLASLWCGPAQVIRADCSCGALSDQGGTGRVPCHFAKSRSPPNGGPDRSSRPRRPSPPASCLVSPLDQPPVASGDSKDVAKAPPKPDPLEEPIASSDFGPPRGPFGGGTSHGFASRIPQEIYRCLGYKAYRAKPRPIRKLLQECLPHHPPLPISKRPATAGDDAAATLPLPRRESHMNFPRIRKALLNAAHSSKAAGCHFSAAETARQVRICSDRRRGCIPRF